MPDTFFNLFTDNIKGTFQVFHISHSGDEHLFDIRFGGSCVFAQAIGISGHIAQMHQCQSFPFYFFNHNT